jgi:hypothetical protein
MALGIASAIRNAMLDAILAAIDAGSGPGKVRIYDGTRPATGGTATTLLAELTMSDPASAGASGGALTLSAVTEDSSADSTGTATWFRVVDSDDNFVLDGSVSVSGGGGDMQMPTTSIVATQPVQISSFVITQGNP